MKGLIIYLTILTILLMGSVVNAGFGLFVHCEDYLCVEGTEVKFEFLFTNNLNSSIIVYNMLVVDENTRENLAVFDEPYIVPIGGNHDINLSTIIRKPLEGYTFYLKPCVKVGFEGSNETKYVCGLVGDQFTITPREKVDCIVDNDCSPGSVCSGKYKCITLECADDEAILKHSCGKLSCKKTEKAINHICVKTGIYAIPGHYWIIGIFFMIIVMIVIYFGGKSPQKKDSEDSEISEKKRRQKKSKRRRK
jgi:hypothetical protein